MQTHQPSGALPERAVERLFTRFAAMYGQAAMQRMWLEVPLPEVKAVWADSLSRFSVAEMLNGLRAIEDSGHTRPPTLPEFIAACRRKPEPPPAAHRRLEIPQARTADEIARGHEIAQRIAESVSNKPKRDPAAWAYRVIERYKTGDPVLSHAAYKGAIEALENLGREVPA